MLTARGQPRLDEDSMRLGQIPRRGRDNRAFADHNLAAEPDRLLHVVLTHEFDDRTGAGVCRWHRGGR